MVSNPGNKVKTQAIDEVILRLLGLNPGVELDYQTYFNIIKKKLAIGRLVGKELPREEDELLREELKKVRGIKDKGLRFKVKTSKAKVSTDASGSAGVGRGGSSPKTTAIVKAKTTKIVPQKIISVNVKDVTENKEERVGSFDEIKKTLNSILSVLASKFKFDKKQSDQERKEKETEKRGKREAGLEGFRKGISAISGAAKKMLAPFQSIIDRIWNFIFFTLLGRAFTQLMDWLGDSANKKKIQVLGRFLKDWWPTLLGAAVLFFTPFGKFVRVTLKIVGSFAGKLVKLIPRIAKAVAGLGRFAAANPLATLITTTAVAGTIARTGERERLKPELDRQRESAAATQRDPNAPWYKKLGGFFAQQELTTGQQQQGIVAPVPGAMFNVGGEVPKLSTGYDGIDSTTGQKVSGFGPDTQMIIAQPGEVVMNKKTVDAVGANNLLALNRQYGGPGANKPKMGRLYNTGGIVGMQGGGNITPENLERTYIQGQKSGMSSDVLKAIGDEAFLLKNFGIGGTWRNFRGSGASNMRGEPLPIQKKQGGGEISQEDLMRQAHNSTVRIERGDGFGGPGSGVLVRNNNGTYSVLTAGHVLKGYVPGEEGNTIKIITPDGKSHDIDPKSVKLGQNDLGSLKFKSDQNYMVARPGDPTKIKKGDQTFVGGYPINPKTGFQDKVLRFSTGQVVDPNSTDPNALSGGQTLRYSNQTQAGMSGGFVFNSRGELIGIHGQSSAKGFISGSGAVPISSSMGVFGSTDTRIPYTNPDLKFLKLTKEQQEKAANTYQKTRGVISDYGGPRGDQYVVGPGQKPSDRIKQGFMGGGFIKENTGMNIKGATADRQLTALQPGEYVLPVDTVSRLGTSLIDKLVAMTDSNSNPAKLGVKSKNIPNITPLSRGGSAGMMTLPPIIQSASGMGNVGNSSGAGSRAPVFSAVSASGARQIAETASILGIVG